MIDLVPYNENYESLIVDYIVSFFGFHSAINGQANSPELTQAKENIEMWTSEKHELYIIESDNTPVGFIHIWYKGGNVAWIEDVFVDESHRGQGIGSEAINSAEDIVKQKSGYTAVCMDVVPRNKNALAKMIAALFAHIAAKLLSPWALPRATTAPSASARFTWI